MLGFLPANNNLIISMLFSVASTLVISSMYFSSL
nr:MAG TPA: hypothetical protein [Caudoviricetes sp.]